MNEELVEKAIDKALEMLGIELKENASKIVQASKRVEKGLDDDTRQFGLKLNCPVTITVDRDNRKEVEVSASARWNTPEVVATGTANVSTHPELELDGKKGEGKDDGKKEATG